MNERTKRHGWIRRHLALVGYVILAVGIAVGFYFLNQSRTAICALSKDLNERIDASQDAIHRGEVFLHHHPEGAFGFSRRDIQLSIASQRRQLNNSERTKKALSVVVCARTHW